MKRNYSNHYSADIQYDTYNCSTIQYKELKYIKKLTNEIAEEKLRFIDDTLLSDLNIGIEDGKTVRKVRRIIEKRVCQSWWKSRSKADRSNYSRSNTKRWVTNQFKNIYHCIPEGYHYCA